MYLTVSILALVFIVTGTVMSVYSLSRYRSQNAPEGIVSLNPRNWRPVWKCRDWFTNARGFRMYWIGMELFGLGALATVFVLLFF